MIYAKITVAPIIAVALIITVAAILSISYIRSNTSQHTHQRTNAATRFNIDPINITHVSGAVHM